MEKLKSFWEDLKFRLGIGLKDIKKGNSTFVGMGSDSDEAIEEIVNKTPNIERLTSEQKVIYRSYLHYIHFGINKSSTSEPLLPIQEEWIKILDILEKETA